MAANLQATIEGLKLADEARSKKGWSKKEKAWADLATTSPTTLGRFWMRIPISAETVKQIYLAVGIEEWKGLVSVDVCETKKTQITDARLKKPKERAIITLNVGLDDISPEDLHIVMTRLAKYGVNLIAESEGSLKLLVEGASEDIERVNVMFRSGKLSDLLSTSVQSVQSAGTDELVKWIQDNDGEDFQLSRANLRGANLSNASLRDANLRDANLIGTNLRGADLIGADLIGANLSGADLIGADLIGANLSGANLSANLIGADLRGANLSGANLSGTDLIGANLSGANLRGANLRGADLRGADLRGATVAKTQFGIGIGLSDEVKQDLIERGAIFDEGSRDRESSPVPSGRR